MLLISILSGCNILSSDIKYYREIDHAKFTPESDTLINRLDINGYYWGHLNISPIRFYRAGIATVQGSAAVYELHGDTLVVDAYTSPGFMNPWSRQTLTFKIQDNTTLMLLGQVSYPANEEAICYDCGSGDRTIYKLYGAPGPFSQHADTTYLRKQKWLWEREEDWQRWMNEHR